MSCRTTSGGSASTTLARIVSKLTDREIQQLFHELKREGSGMAAPSELDVAEWRERQNQLIENIKNMVPSKKDNIRSRLFRSRGEPVPDGAMFYAWSRIENRARQEVAIRNVPNAVDLAPPLSQVDDYEFGEDGRPARVWYASYGSNLSRNRFMNYIEGGTPAGSSRTYEGCTDKTPPESDIPIRFAGPRPHFALTSLSWTGGIAFVDDEGKDTTEPTALGRAYNISMSQFDETVRMENGGSAKTATPIDINDALINGRSVTGDGIYETMVHIGDYQGAPVVTFTAPFSANDCLTQKGVVKRGKRTLPTQTNKPSHAYVRVIGDGLQETFGMSEVAAADYLRGCPGGDRYTRTAMVKMLRTDPPPRTPKTVPTAAGPIKVSPEQKNRIPYVDPRKNKTAQTSAITYDPPLGGKAPTSQQVPLFSSAPTPQYQAAPTAVSETTMTRGDLVMANKDIVTTEYNRVFGGGTAQVALAVMRERLRNIASILPKTRR